MIIYQYILTTAITLWIAHWILKDRKHCKECGSILLGTGFHGARECRNRNCSKFRYQV